MFGFFKTKLFPCIISIWLSNNNEPAKGKRHADWDWIAMLPASFDHHHLSI